MRSRALAQIPAPVAEDLIRLGTLIRDARGRRGFTQAELAERLRLSPTTVRAAEQGDPAVAAGIVASLLWTLGMGPISTSVAAAHPGTTQPKQRVRSGKRLDDF
jgi:ribosome-binding protein aMBF1 (putative translation factor)